MISTITVIFYNLWLSSQPECKGNQGVKLN